MAQDESIRTAYFVLSNKGRRERRAEPCVSQLLERKQRPTRPLPYSAAGEGAEKGSVSFVAMQSFRYYAHERRKGLGGCARFASLTLGDPGGLKGGAAALMPSSSIITKDGRDLVWNGKRFLIVDQTRAAVRKELPLPQRVQMNFQEWQVSTWSAFFPRPSSVTDDYWEYSKWRCHQRFCTSMLGILATQAMLQAVGVGAKRSLPAAATLNWVLKDGLGKMGRISVATLFGRGFDSDLKRCRFQTSVLFSVSTFLEMLTPWFPRHFLALASLAMVGKSISLTTHVATQPAFHKSFAKGETMAEISAKTQAQQVVMDNLGLAAVVIIRKLLGANNLMNNWLPLALFPILVVGDLYSISRELHSVELKTINHQRGELIAERWVKEGKVPSVLEMAQEEMLFFKPRIDRGPHPLNFSPISQVAADPSELEHITKLYKREKYLLNCMPRYSKEPNVELKRGDIHVSFQAKAEASDVLLSMLQAAHFRRMCHSMASPPVDRTEALRSSLSAAKKDLRTFQRELSRIGWVTDPIMLSADIRDNATFVQQQL